MYVRSRTTRITLDGILRGKITIMLKIKNQNPFNKDKSVGLKFALVVESGKLNFTYITVLK